MICERCLQEVVHADDHGVWKCPFESRARAAAVFRDGIPGGLEIFHGLCNDDGTPRTYYSQTEITRECKKRGLIRWSDMHSEDKVKEARQRMADEARRHEARR